MAKYAYVYDENNADLLSESRQLVENTGVALRRFQHNIPVGEWDALLQEMWATRLYVDNPQADRKAGQDPKYRLAGRWRVASLRKSGPGEPIGIYEELRLGWLQPPGTDGDYPSSGGDPNNWAGIDSQVRIIKVREFDDANRTLSGENIYYMMIIPGVATKTINEFCNALANRTMLVNPVFGLQTGIEGKCFIRGVRNEDQGDGSSNVICSLARSDYAFVPGEYQVEKSWNETVSRNFYKNYPNYPVVPINVEAVESAPGSGVHVIKAQIYQVGGADIDPGTGLWMVTSTKRTAEPGLRSWTYNDKTGVVTLFAYWNQTLDWTTSKSGALLATNKNSFPTPSRNEFNLYDGGWSVHGVVDKDKDPGIYNKGFFYEYITAYRWDHGGRYIMEVWRITCRYRSDLDIGSGYVDFHLGTSLDKDGNVVAITGGATPPGIRDSLVPPLMEFSYFKPIGKERYEFKRTIKAELATKDLTYVYETTGRYLTGSTQNATFSEIVPGV